MTSTTLLIPAVCVGLGTDTATVVDVRTGSEVTVRVSGVILRQGVVYLPAESLGVENGLHLVRFTGGEVAWVYAAESFSTCEGCAA
ncbi:hypothetical protein [Limnoglobus roseus]|uniref:Uncharacterized protein n=1 Tax=Limnoglobus roseus TaxID=2598579 RepID=A0A5C1APL7_9BACT|nr:hypothetical protein [Limnoglobus roseus]QEL21111.1 hypothetical protein PX52LOC_08241 [Limnoglobus roseus]